MIINLLFRVRLDIKGDENDYVGSSYKYKYIELDILINIASKATERSNFELQNMYSTKELIS